MVTSSKILTVTYGTFSCTLEGFDDPFTTLQMVAEYFRKLAAEDRYFGGTPQTPDTDTLKRIAQENNPNGIDAVAAEDGIILRQTETPEAVSEEDVDGPSEDDADLLIFDSIRNEVDAAFTDFDDEFSSADEETEEETPDPGDFDAAISLAETEEKTTPLTFFRSRRNDTETDDLAEIQEAEAAPVSQADADGAAIEAAISAAGIAATATALRHATQAPEPPATERPVLATKSVEETLAAIRQNVEQAESSIVDEDTPEKPVEPDQAKPLILQAEVVEQAAELPQESDHETAQTSEITEPDEDVSLHANTPKDEPLILDAQTTIAADVPVEQPEEEIALDSSLTDEQEAELAADLAAAMELEEEEPEEEVTAQPDTFFDEAPEIAAEEPAPEPLADAQTSRAEILRGSDNPDGEDKSMDRLLEATQSKMNRPEQVRRMNALEQLKAAVAATEADRQVRRKSVAATKNEAEVGEAADLAAYRDDLRRAQDSARLDGLKSAPGGQAATPVAASSQVQQAPLILVSEQRIDEVPLDGIDTVEPEPQREVAEIAGNLALKPEFQPAEEAADDPDNQHGEIQGIPADAFSDATSFSDFAERIGAFELTDLLEASAAYTTIVEGKQRFSRAQVMSKLAKLNMGEAYSKEAGLRSFGKLLREGKLLRVQDGQFGISKSSRFSIASRYVEE